MVDTQQSIGIEQESLKSNISVDAQELRDKIREFYPRKPKNPEEGLRKLTEEVIGVSLDNLPLITQVPLGVNEKDLTYGRPLTREQNSVDRPVYQLGITVNGKDNKGDRSVDKLVLFQKVGHGHDITADILIKNGDEWKYQGGNHDYNYGEFIGSIAYIPEPTQE